MIKRMKGEEKQSDRREMKSKNNRRKKKESLENLEIQLLPQHCIDSFKILHSIDDNYLVLMLLEMI
jgi:hypothetical protein